MPDSLLSIDFGATTTTAAYRDRHGVEHLVELASGGPMSSAVFVDGSRVRVGDAARARAVAAPESFEAHPLLRLGEATVPLAGRDEKVTRLVAAVLQHAVRKTAEQAREPFSKIILAYPDRWSDLERDALIDAAAAAGIRSTDTILISQAQAAAEFYTSAPAHTPATRVCVVDIGGRTAAASVLDRTAGGAFAVTASGAITHFGGADLDGRLFDSVVARLAPRRPELIPPAGDIAGRLALLDLVRTAKVTLSTASRASIEISDDHRVQITRSEFEELITDDLGRCAALVAQVIADANGRESRAVDKICLVGGSTSIPLLHRLLSGSGELAPLTNPAEVVARGGLCAIGGPAGQPMAALSILYQRQDFLPPAVITSPPRRIVTPLVDPPRIAPPPSRPIPAQPPVRAGQPGPGVGNRADPSPNAASPVAPPAPQLRSAIPHPVPPAPQPASQVAPPAQHRPQPAAAEPRPNAVPATRAPVSQPIPAATPAAPGAHIVVPNPPADAAVGDSWTALTILVPLAATVRAGTPIATTTIGGRPVELISPIDGVVRLVGQPGSAAPGTLIATIAPTTTPGARLSELPHYGATPRLADGGAGDLGGAPSRLGLIVALVVVLLIVLVIGGFVLFG